MTNKTDLEAFLRDKGYITTFSGQEVNCPHLEPRQVFLQDVARSLAMQVRYLGHLRAFYSVAEHSVLVSRMAEHDGAPLIVQRAAFLHDAHEAYVGDFPSPFKSAVHGLPEFEDEVERAVREAFDVAHYHDAVWRTVKVYDRRALHFEASELFVRTPRWVDWDEVARVPTDLHVRALDWVAAEAEFRLRARELGIGVGPTRR